MKKQTILKAGLLVLLGTFCACANNTPTTAAPTTNTPTTVAPTTVAPTTAAPTTTAKPTTAAPTTTAKPTTATPTTQTPTTAKPTTATPTTVPPTTVPPTTQTPTTQTPTTVVPTTNAISGNIVDNLGAAVKDVSVYLNVGSTTVQIAKTDASGVYSFTDVSAATYNLILVPPSDGYEYTGEKISFTYEGGSLTIDTITLKKTNMNWGSLS